MDWIRLSQDRDRWRAVVSAVMNLRILAPRSQLVIPTRDLADMIDYDRNIYHARKS
jgi:hypothetical protein